MKGVTLIVLLLTFIGVAYGQPQWVAAKMAEMTFLFSDIAEDTPINTVLGRLPATDSAGRRVTYSTNSTEGFFSIDYNTGDIKLIRPLDREREEPLRSVVFIATNSDGQATAIRFAINIRDVNDNSPIFTNAPYRVNVPENTQFGTVVLRPLTIRDRDSGNNAVVRVRCDTARSPEACAAFTVGANQVQQGWYEAFITLNQNLNYDVRNGYTMYIIAEDRGNPSRSASTEVTINVENRDMETSPDWVNPEYTLTVMENAPRGKSVWELSARDRNQNNNFPLKIKITDDPLRFFRLGQTFMVGGNVYKATLESDGHIDREAMPNSGYFVTFRAVEMNGNRETGSAIDLRVQVIVTDENDNRPVFRPGNGPGGTYVVLAPEDLAKGAALPGLSIQVDDIDQAGNRVQGDAAKMRLKLQTDQPYTYYLPSGSATMEVQGTATVNILVNQTWILDYEVAQYRHQILTLIAEEMQTGRSSSALITLNVEDANDNSPIFTQQGEYGSVNEDAPIGTSIITVQATDADSGAFGQVRYSLQSVPPEDASYFSMDALQGVVRLAQPLNYEGRGGKPFNLRVVATDGGGASTTKVLIIAITDINEKPKFNDQTVYNTYVTEGSLDLNPPITIQAVDSEQGTLTYRIYSGNTAAGAFNIHPRTGVLSLSTPVGYQQTPNKQGYFELVIEASDAGGKTATISVVVNVRDINDHAPVFNPAVYTAVISELAPPATSVVTVTATDDDSGLNAAIRYEIYSGAKNNFGIDITSGLITVRNGADLDTRRNGATYNIIVYGRDGGNPQKTGTAQVTVTIQDANNQPPRFSQNVYLGSIREGMSPNTLVMTVEAPDEDYDSSVQYSILQNTYTARDKQGNPVSNSRWDYTNAFVIGQSNGEIRTRSTVVVDRVSEVSFVIKATDVNGQTPTPQTATATITLRLQSMNDGQLRFQDPWTESNPRFTLDLSEDKRTDTPIIILQASDPTATQPLQINYREAPGSDPNNIFTVQTATGYVFLTRQLDYDSAGPHEFSFQVIATTQETNPKSAMATVAVRLTDVNDNNPVFDQNSYAFEVREDARYPKVIGTVRATDKDSGPNGQVVFSLTSQQTEFTIDRNSGNIMISRGVILDRKKQDIYNLQVQASDSGREVRTIYTTVRITILPPDDTGLPTTPQPPQFRADKMTISMLDNTPAGTSLSQLKPTDLDAELPPPITWSIRSGNDGNLFTINARSGEITTRQDLSLLSRTEPYRLVIIGETQTNPPRSAQTEVEIYVKSSKYDNQDNPRFMYPPANDYPIYINEELPLGSALLTVRAVDLQPGSNGGVLYSFSDLDALKAIHQMFRINPTTGEITLAARLDRETMKATSFKVIVVARTQTIPSTENSLSFVLNIDDINDNTPSFYGCSEVAVDDPQQAMVDEEVAANQTVTQVTGCDKDGPPNNQLYYHIICGNEPMRNGQVPFWIDRTGIIKTAARLDREQQAEYLLCVKVTNSPRYTGGTVNAGDRSDPAIIRVRVTVRDQDDNAPNFNSRNFTAGVLASASYHAAVVRIQASDLDSPTGSSGFTYSMGEEVTFVPAYGNQYVVTSTPFTIELTTGTVFTNQMHYLDYTTGYFILPIIVRDPKGRTARTTLYVNVVRDGELLRFRFTKSPEAVIKDLPIFISKVGNELKVDTTVDGVRYHVKEDGGVDFDKTDVCFHMVSQDTRQVIQPIDAQRLVEKNEVKLNPIYEQYNATYVGKCLVHTRTYLWSGYWWLWWFLIALALLIWLLALFFIIFLLCCHKIYKKKVVAFKPYVILDPMEPPLDSQSYEWQETTVKMG